MTSVSSSALPSACLCAPAARLDALPATPRGNDKHLMSAAQHAAADEPHDTCIVAVPEEFEGGDLHGGVPAPTAELMIADAPDVADTGSDMPAVDEWIVDVIESFLRPVVIRIIVFLCPLLLLRLAVFSRTYDVPAFALVLLAVFLCYGLRDESADRPFSDSRQLTGVLGEMARTRS